MEKEVYSSKTKRNIVSIILILLFLSITIPVIVLLLNRGDHYTNSPLIVNMSQVELSILSQNETLYDEENQLLSIQIARGQDEIDLEFIYFLTKINNISYTYIANALDINTKQIYYFGEIVTKPSRISVFSSIPLVKEGEDMIGNYNLVNVPLGNLNEEKILESGNWIYLADDRIKTLNCEDQNGIIASPGSYCFVGRNKLKGYCNNFGECMPYECVVDDNCYRGINCETSTCTKNNTCEYSKIENCKETEGICGDFKINVGEECDIYTFGNLTSNEHSEELTKCDENCQIR